MLDAFRYLLYTSYYAGIMLDALGTYYAQNYAGIIDRSLIVRRKHPLGRDKYN